MIIGITGRMAAGKSSTANALVARHGFVAVSLADEMKRCVASIYGFTEEQLWGPSERRNAPDKRYPREHGPWKETLDDFGKGPRCMCCGIRWSFRDDSEPQCYLTPRFALQLLGTEWGRTCFEDTWVRKALFAASRLLTVAPTNDRPPYFPSYSARRGGGGDDARSRAQGVIIPDVRYDNEAKAIRAAGGWIVRKAGNEDAAVTHTSEAGIDKELIDYELSWWNDPTDPGREKEIETMVEQLKGKRS